MIAVVTGASGFIGRHLVGRLGGEGHVVRCLVRPHGGKPPAGVERTAVDLNDPTAMRACAALDGADVVFHLAAATRARSAAAFREANVAPTRNLLDAIVARRTQSRFVYVSSQAAAGPAGSIDQPLTEDHPPRPVEEYGRSKLEAERVVATFGDRLSTAIVRPCSVFGPCDRDFLRLFQMALKGFVVYPGVATHWLSLLHVDDVVDGLLAAARSNAPLRSFFLAPAKPVQWKTLGEEIGTAFAGRPLWHLNVPGGFVRAAAHASDLLSAFMLETPLLNSNKTALSRHPYWVCNADRARRELGWQSRRSLPDAVRDTYLWYEQHGWLRGRGRAAVTVA